MTQNLTLDALETVNAAGGNGHNGMYTLSNGSDFARWVREQTREQEKAERKAS